MAIIQAAGGVVKAIDRCDKNHNRVSANEAGNSKTSSVSNSYGDNRVSVFY